MLSFKIFGRTKKENYPNLSVGSAFSGRGHIRDRKKDSATALYLLLT